MFTHPRKRRRRSRPRSSEPTPPPTLQTASPGGPTPDLEAESEAEIATEHESYQLGIRNRLLWSGGTAIVVTLGAFLLHFLLEIGQVDDASKVRIVLAPVPSDVAIGAFGVLATLAVALQVAVRAPRNSGTPAPRDLARKHFLSALAGGIGPASMTLGLYLSLQYLDFPGSIDIVRNFGPILLALLIALIAADAEMANRSSSRQAILQEAARGRRIEQLEAGLATFSDRGRAPSRSRRFWQGVLLIGVPLAVVSALSVFGSEPSPFLTVTMIIAELVICLFIYTFLVKTTQYLAIREWITWAVMLTVSVVLAIYAILIYLVQGLVLAGESGGWAPVARALLTLTIEVAVPIALGLRSLAKRPASKPRGLLRHLVVSRIETHLDRARAAARPTEPETKAPWNILAILSAALTVVPPFGLVFAVLARQQIRAADEAQSGGPSEQTGAGRRGVGQRASGRPASGQRGLALATTMLWINGIGLLLALAGLMVIGMVNPDLF
ncbi:hypothetical protein [Leucobacter iarius]|uniref:Uncharacterized protein n=1 Tax=Leucobacter iarius TaxID=333963 RepID=A0ABN2L7M4_9MICO